MNPIYKSYTFWTLVAGLAGFILKFYMPDFPIDTPNILAVVLFLLGLIGVVPTLRAQGRFTVNIVNSLAFWQLVAGLLIFVMRFYASNFPIDENTLLGAILFILSYFNIKPELQVRGLTKT